MRDVIERVLLGILIVPALLFIGLLALLPFFEWSRLHGIEKLGGLAFSVVCLLVGVALVTILFRKRAPEQPEEKPKHSPWEETVFGYYFQKMSTDFIAYAVIFTVVFIIIMAWWEYHYFHEGQASQEDRAITDIISLIAVFIAAMIIGVPIALRKAWHFVRRHASKKSNGDSSS